MSWAARWKAAARTFRDEASAWFQVAQMRGDQNAWLRHRNAELRRQIAELAQERDRALDRIRDLDGQLTELHYRMASLEK